MENGILGLQFVLPARLDRADLEDQAAGITICPSSFREDPQRALCKACPGGGEGVWLGSDFSILNHTVSFWLQN